MHNSLEVNEYLVKAKHRLAEHDGVEGLVYFEAAEGSERGHGVNGRDESREGARLAHRQRGGPAHLAGVVDYPPGECGGAQRPYEQRRGIWS